ncbi:MAG TPA: signal peptidase II [Myxococcales bacterium]|jgi:signal peptidase II|nr:signal peptidase II [Myxococcales bacterium]
MAPVPRSLRALLLAPLLLTLIGCDQATKDLAQRELLGQGPSIFLGGLFKLVYVENPGAFLGLGNSLGPQLRFWLFVVGVGVALVAGLLTLLLRKELSWGGLVVGALIVAGGFGNLIDRIANEGRVVDFMQLGLGSLRTGIFNVADVLLMLGVALMAWPFRKAQETAGPSPAP